jgi:hypothetical protein
MGSISRTVATLRFFGDDLQPDEITEALCRPPTESTVKGAEWTTPSGRHRVANKGSWRLCAQDREPGDLDGQIEELLSGLTEDLSIWADLAERFRADVFCGLFLDDFNEGISLSPRTLELLGSRHLLLDLDIDSSSDEGE